MKACEAYFTLGRVGVLAASCVAVKGDLWSSRIFLGG